jgi:transcriptional regulator with XRE-family HTH domain
MSTLCGKIDLMNGDKINAWVNQKRKAHKMSKRELALEIDTDPSHLNKVLSNKRQAAFDFYLRIARYFNAVPEFLRIADILPDEDQPGALFADILAAVKELTIEERQEVLRYALFVKQGRDTQSEPRAADAQT